MNHNHSRHNAEPPSFWRSRYAIGPLVMGAVGAYFVMSEHRAHFIYALPFLLLLACPVMHVFMHHGRGSHGGHDGREQGTDPPTIETGERP